jgi:hypothetical protein
VAQALHRPVADALPVGRAHFLLHEVGRVEQRRGQRGAQLVGQPGHHLAHRGEPLVALGGQAHLVGLGDVAEEHDAALAGLKRRVDPAHPPQGPCISNCHSPGVSVAARRAAQNRPSRRRPARPRTCLHRPVGLHHAAVPVEHHDTGRQRAHQHAEALGQLGDLGLQAGVGAGEGLRGLAELAEGFGQLAGIETFIGGGESHEWARMKFTASQLRPARQAARRQIGGKNRR